ncbi:aldose 1-epimerase family protein [Mucilaginibacter arboris]|uniref:Aldose 1-epimerase family protein n=1 Tax=Mucilaginibacter arboris TaxID=2682090 RepID=A0A7K1SXA7_9SPHI|nr:aldose 1-epimerase family protein [Mucilaginibacter arboris]MVN21954.1 aldose 1-epimerase family protein [Mucilaginibacter arboris]
MISIENEFLTVSFRTKGAEMTSFFNKKTKTEHLWQANPDVWPWYAPNLFPIVGGLFNNELHVNGQTYHMTRHGFTRESEFKLVDITETHAKFSLPFSEATLAAYPYRFEFQVLYDLFDQDLRVTYKVINQDEQTVYFSMGAHPAFHIPFKEDEKYEDYYLEFETSQPLLTHLLSANGLMSGEREVVPTEDQKLWLTKHLFDRDALVFKSITSKKVTIRSKNHEHSLLISFDNFKDLGIWAKPGAPFVCIEPWLGYSDTEGEVNDIQQKAGIESVGHGHVYEATFTISVNS